MEFPEQNLAPKLTIISHLTSTDTLGWETPRVFVYASQSPSDSSTFVTPANLDVEVTELETDYSIRLDLSNEGERVFSTSPKIS